MRNVEIKARVQDLCGLLARAAALSGSGGVVLRQDDTFYNLHNCGRLKLRKCEQDKNGELIYYERPDSVGPKTSDYEKCNLTSLDEAESLGRVLERALGSAGRVKKTRRLFLVGQTRIHVDQVENLGNFMELEVVLNPEQDAEEGQAVARDLMEQLGVKEDDLVSGAYRDLLEKNSGGETCS